MRGNASMGRRVRHAVFWLSSFGSIALLLGHLYAVAPMSRLAVTVGCPLTLIMTATWIWGRRANDADFLWRLRAGFVGGLWGTIGYDLVRIPFHLLGYNPFSPIRAYGVWLAGMSHSTPWTDTLGFVFHFSNGITFGWIYALLYLRRHWGWGVVWGLALESLAVATVFGDVFRIRAAYGMLGLAYAAHLFYGAPLGRICQHPEAALKTILPMHRRRHGLYSLAICAGLLAWFLTAWQPLEHQPRLDAGRIIFGPNAVYPGWANWPAGSSLALTNALSHPLTVKFRRPSTPLSAAEELTLDAGATQMMTLQETGTYQFGVLKPSWRSVFVAVHRDGVYRPEDRQRK